MRGTFNVRQDAFLWRFYCKRFTIEGEKVEHPKNFCRYFWTSVNGFGLWLGREVRLRSLWLISLLVTAIFFGMACAITDINNTVATILVVTVSVLWNFAFVTAMLVTLYRVKPLVLYLLGFCVIVVVIANSATRGTLWPELTRLFDDFLRRMGFVLIVMVAAIIIALIFSTIPHRRLQKLRRVFQTLGAFVSAKKSSVCPPVNPPEDFGVKP